MQINNGKFSRFVEDLKKTVKGLIKSQLILSSLTLIALTIGLTMFDIKFAFLIAIGITMVDILPVVGSGILMIPWAAYYMIFGDNMQLGIKIALLYVGVTIVRGILEPIIRGKTLGLNPLMTLISSVFGFLIFGGIGLIIGPVVAIISQSAYKFYMRKNEISDRWD